MKKNISVFDNYFEPQIRERGIGYFYNDLVKDIQKEDHLYAAKINGTRVYNVKIKLNEEEDKILEADCNCPYSVDREKYCKHIYALLYSLKGEKMNNKPIHKERNVGEAVNIKCPNCGANLLVDSPAETIECKYCHSSFALDIRLVGQAKRLNEIMEQAELYFDAEDYKEAYYEYAKALKLDPDNKYIKYFMGVSSRLKNIETNLGLTDYNRLFNEMKDACNEESTNDDQKKKMCISFMNLVTIHANKHLNRIDITGRFFWSELDISIDYCKRLLHEFNISKELRLKVYNHYLDILRIEIREYDTFASDARVPKEVLLKELHNITQEEKNELKTK